MAISDSQADGITGDRRKRPM